MNIVIASGVAQKPELRYTPDGLAILEARLAGQRALGDGRTVFSMVGFTAFGKLAETAAESVKDERTPLLLVGRVNYRSWDDPNGGGKRSSVNVVADELHRLREFETVPDEYGGQLLVGARNEVTLAGNLTRDAEMRYTPNGVPLVNVSMAVNEWNAAKRESTAHFIDATVWRDAAEALGALEPKKGSRFYLRGSCRLASWEKDGQKRYKFQVDADDALLLGAFADASAGQGPRAPQSGDAYKERARQAVNNAGKPLDIDDEFPPEEDLPF